MMEKRLPSRIRRKRNIKIKKSTIGMFAMLFAFVFAMFRVFAGENNTITVETKSANRGDTITLKVNLSCQEAYNSAGVIVEFDTDVLEFVKVASIATVANPGAVAENDEIDPIAMLAAGPSKASDIATANSEGKVSLGYGIDGETACEDIEMAKLRFKVKEDAPLGTSPLTVTASMGREVDDVLTVLTVDTENGAVILALPVDPESVKLANENLTIQKGETDQIVVEYEPEETTDSKEFTYTGYDEDIISVATDGTVTANAVGTTDVTVTAFGQVLTAHVTVTNPVKSVTVTGSKHDIEVDEQLQLSAEVLPADAEGGIAVTWSSSDETIATVSNSGKVTGKGLGTATITATSVAKNDVVGTFNVNVIVPITSFTLTSNANVELNKNDSSTITYTILPAENSEEDAYIEWTTSNEDVALVSNGVVSAVGGGTATITGTLKNTMNEFDPITVNVTVNVPLESIGVDKTSLDLYPEQTQDIIVSFTPSDATNKNVTWSSSNSQVASVNQSGTITAEGPGNATITVRSNADESIYATISVHVIKRVTGATIKPSGEVTLEKGETEQLSVDFIPSDADEENVTVSWESADPSSVSVTSNGLIEGKKGTTSPVKITGTLSNGAGTVECMVTVIVPLTEINLNKTSMTLARGANDTLTVSYNPTDTTDNKEVVWASGDETIATVENGVVTAVGKGVTTITATVGTHSKTCQVTVNVPVSSVNITSDDFELARSKTKELAATINPGDADSQTITWSSDNESVATVDSNGVVTAVAKGSANITATVGGKSDSVKVTVFVPVDEFTTPEATKTILRKETTTISTTINPSDADEERKVITWESDDETVATVDENGTVTGVAAGTAKITGRLPDGKKVEVTVTVQIVNVEAIEINSDDLNLNRKETETLTATYSPENATEVTDITWSSSDPTVASVDENGTVTALKEGTTTITAAMGQITDSIEVTVTEIPLEGVTLEGNSNEATVGQDYTLVPTLEPFDATDDVTYTYTSSDPEIASVDENGKVTFKKAGKVSITIVASNGEQEYEDTIELTVNAPTSPQTGVTPIWVYGGIIAILLVTGAVICKKKELF